VCRRAEQVLANIERHELNVAGDPVMQSPADATADRISQLDLFRSPMEEVVDLLRRLDPESTTPLDALNLLADLRTRVLGEN
jgi:hypothetical protein